MLGLLALHDLPTMGHSATMWTNAFSDATILTESECFEHLGQVSLGRIAASIDALPVILPVRFVLCGKSVLFPTVPGSKLDEAATGAVVAFQADAEVPLTRTYWSVLLQGVASSVGDWPELAQEPVIPLEQGSGLRGKPHMVRIEATIVSGRRFRIAGEISSVEFPDALSL